MRFRLNPSMALLTVSLATLSVLAVSAHHANRAHRATALSLLRDYAAFGVWNYSSRAESALNETAARALHGVPHIRRMYGGAPERLLDPALLAVVFEEAACSCNKGAESGHGIFAYSPAADSLVASVPLTDAQVKLARATLDRLPATAGKGAAALATTSEGEWLAYAALQAAEGPRILLGAFVDSAAVPNALRKVFGCGALLPPSLTRGAPIDSLLAISVYARDADHPIWSSAARPKLDLAAEDTLALGAGGLIARAAIRPEAAATLIIGGLPRSKLPLLYGLLALTTALALLSVRQMRRERALVQTRERFVTSVSHELRTPLAQIRLFIETIRMGRTGSNAEREWAIAHIERETTRLAHLVENVLHVSKPRKAPRLLAPALELRPEVEDVVQSFLPLARSRRVRLEARCTGEPLVAMRREHLRQVLLNLLDNAVKYGPPGQVVRVTVSASHDQAQIEVADQGPGIAPSDRARIWDPYYRGDSQQTLVSGGTGIGLSIVRDLVTEAGGSVGLGDALPGACFKVSLPLIQVGPRAQPLAHAAIDAG